MKLRIDCWICFGCNVCLVAKRMKEKIARVNFYFKFFFISIFEIEFFFFFFM